MHQLTVFEMEEISGGALTDTLTDIVTGPQRSWRCRTGRLSGRYFWYSVRRTLGWRKWRYLRYRLNRPGVGMIAGVILGGVCFGIAAGIVGWDMTLDYAQGVMDAIYDGTLNFWSN